MMNFKVILKLSQNHHTLKLLIMLKVLRVKITASIVHNSHHKQKTKYICHNHDYISKILHC